MFHIDWMILNNNFGVELNLSKLILRMRLSSNQDRLEKKNAKLMQITHVA